MHLFQDCFPRLLPEDPPSNPIGLTRVFLPISTSETGKDPGTSMIGSCQRILLCSTSISVAVRKCPDKMQLWEENGLILGDCREVTVVRVWVSWPQHIRSQEQTNIHTYSLPHSLTYVQLTLCSYTLQGPALGIMPATFRLGLFVLITEDNPLETCP